MKHSKQSHDLVRQNEKVVKQSQKHDANLQKNSTLYFQIGLIICLLAALGLLEMQFETKPIDTAFKPEVTDVDFMVDIPKFKPYVEPEEQKQTKQKEEETRKFINKIEQVDDGTDLPEEVKYDTPDSTSPGDFDPSSIDDTEFTEEIIVKFVEVEQVPIYPGCEKYIKDNEDLRKCMSDKINKLVRKKFNGGIASEYGLSGVQRIYVEFQVDKQGEVKDIQTRAPHPKLEEEAKRVVDKIPSMEPGKQRNEPVGVRYTLPIIFKVD